LVAALAEEHAPSMSSDQRADLFHEVNDRIYELLESGDSDLPGEFLCECGRDCGRRVVLLPAAFASLRDSGAAVRSSDCRRGLLGRRGPRSETVDGVPALS
jgi:hypothetical protein